MLSQYAICRGRVVRLFIATDNYQVVNENTLYGEVAVKTTETGSPSSFMLKDGEIKPIPTRPSPVHIFNYATEQWVDSRTESEIRSAAISQAIGDRNRRLLRSDWTDTVSAKSRLGDALYTAWQTYRQALRDITAQPGYPLNIKWPVPPV